MKRLRSGSVVWALPQADGRFGLLTAVEAIVTQFRR